MLGLDAGGCKAVTRQDQQRYGINIAAGAVVVVIVALTHPPGLAETVMLPLFILTAALTDRVLRWYRRR